MPLTLRFQSKFFLHLSTVCFLMACGSGGGSTSSTSHTNSPAPTSAGVVIAPLGSPRILIADAATLSRYQSLLTAQTPSATRWKAMVDAEVAGARAYGFEPWYAALLSRITNTASYCTFAVARTEAFVTSEEALIANNQRAQVAGDSYLEVGPYIGNLAMVYDWCRASMTSAQRTRWVTYANQAVWNVWNPAQARWGSGSYPWSGWSVDNPVNNYYYSFLQATMLLGLASFGENAQAAQWIDIFRTQKLENQLFPTFTRDLQGGGSREGTGYGTAMKNLWRLYDWWERSTTERVANKTPHTLASLAHLMHNIVPTLDRLAPTGDHARDSTAALFDYHRDYLQVLMRLYPTERLAGTAKSLLAQSSVPAMANQFMYYSDYLYDASDITAQPLANLSTAHWGSGTGMLATRSSWVTNATYVNMICGPYIESHAHHDQGSFVLFKGNWLAYDANIASQSGIAQSEELHNLVRVEQNGSVVTQREGAAPCELQAMADNANYTYGVAQVTPIYDGKPQVVKVEREILFLKPGTLVVMDRVQTSGAGIRRVWGLNLPAAPVVTGDSLRLTQGSNWLDVIRLAPTGLTTQVRNWPALDPDVRAGVRVDVADSAGDTSVFLHVLSTDGATTSAVRADSVGRTGAQITLASGRTATVQFNNTSPGGVLDLRESNGSSVSSGALPATVQLLPLFVN